MSNTVAIILAAGTSSRFGKPKLLATIDGKPVIWHVVDRAARSSVDDIVVVIGAHGPQVMAALRGMRVNFAFNEKFAMGQGTSVASGIEHVRRTADAAVMLLGDQPGIEPDLISNVVTARQEGASIVMTLYGSGRSHPVLFGREHFDALAALTGDQGGREIIARHADQVVVVDGDDAQPPMDIDTVADWRIVQEMWHPFAERDPATRDWEDDDPRWNDVPF